MICDGWLKLDPRTKIVLVLVLSASIAWAMTLPVELACLAAILLLNVASGFAKDALKLVVLYTALNGLSAVLNADLFIVAILGTIVHLALVFFLPFSAAGYLVRSTQVSELMASMEQLYLPRGLIISLCVMLRYMPCLRKDVENIGVAMHMRGIRTGLGALLTPMKSLEYVFVPLLSGASVMADDLSMAAYTRGVDIPGRKSRYFACRLGWADALVFSLLAALIVWRFVWT